MSRFTRKKTDTTDIKTTWIIDGTEDKWIINDHGNWTGPAITKLAEFENAQENGRLLMLPYSIGDVVYKVAPNMCSNRMDVVPVVVSSIFESVNIAFSPSNTYFPAFEDAKSYLDSHYEV